MPDGPVKVSEVFVPGRLPQFTYNPRAELQLERRVRDYLDEGGAILTLAGPTKTGKSVLLRHVITDPIWCDGQGIDSVETLWALIADELELFKEIATVATAGSEGGGSVQAEAGFAPIAKIGSQAVYKGTESTARSFKIDRPLVSVVKGALTTLRRPLVIDDFHFILRPVQREIVRALKPLVLNGSPIVFASISHRVQDVVSAEPDMTGRVEPLEIPLWREDELVYIAHQGFKTLNFVDGESLGERLATESYGSPHLMQKFCRELCKTNGLRTSTDNPTTLKAPDDWTGFLRAQVDATSKGWFEKLLSGPVERGTKRTQWSIRDDGKLDGYGLTLLAICKTGPKLELTKDEIRVQVDSLVDGPGPAAAQTTRVLQHMSRIASKRASQPLTVEELDSPEADPEAVADAQPVIEYMDDDPNSRLHIADPFFAFFMRYGGEPLLAKSSETAPLTTEWLPGLPGAGDVVPPEVAESRPAMAALPDEPADGGTLT